jgi:hypothetical protein
VRLCPVDEALADESLVQSREALRAAAQAYDVEALRPLVALAAVARRLGRDDRIVAWGVSNQAGAAIVRILHTARLAVRERFADVDGIPVVWSELPKGAFERVGCSVEP